MLPPEPQPEPEREPQPKPEPEAAEPVTGGDLDTQWKSIEIGSDESHVDDPKLDFPQADDLGLTNDVDTGDDEPER